jgi:hypothetical protein
MKLYEIALPMFTNGGLEYDEAIEAWRRVALDKAGGFTDVGEAHGYWLDNNRLYQDQVRRFHVACKPEVWEALIDAAFGLFTDQVSIFHACLGEATIVGRTEWLASVGFAAVIGEAPEARV